MKSLLRKADKLAATLRDRQMRQEGLCPRCGLPVAEKIIVFRDKPPEVCTCEPRLCLDLSGPAISWRALDPESGLLVEPETLQAKYKKDEVQDGE